MTYSAGCISLKLRYKVIQPPVEIGNQHIQLFQAYFSRTGRSAACEARFPAYEPINLRCHWDEMVLQVRHMNYEGCSKRLLPSLSVRQRQLTKLPIWTWSSVEK